jgi:hypothetical protein
MTPLSYSRCISRDYFVAVVFKEVYCTNIENVFKRVILRVLIKKLPLVY